MTQQELNRYSRHLMLPGIGLQGQRRLRQASVLMIGAGGLGCPVLQYLAAAGVGRIGIVDSDHVEESNLQRQVLYSTADTGRLKAEVAAEKLRLQNPFIEITDYCMRLEPGNALELLSGYDLVIDGSDNFATRYLVNDACVALGKPLVFGSIYQFEGQVSVFNYQGGPTYRCLYPEASELQSCSEAGVIGVLPGIIGSLMANECIKIITGAGDVLSGKLLLFDALKTAFLTLSYKHGDYDYGAAGFIDQQKTEYSACETPLPAQPEEISSGQLLQLLENGEPLTLIDVREPEEHSARNIGGICLPLNELPQHLKTISASEPVVVYCESGVRSKKAAGLLLQHGFEKVFSLTGGVRSAPDELLAFGN